MVTVLILGWDIPLWRVSKQKNTWAVIHSCGFFRQELFFVYSATCFGLLRHFSHLHLMMAYNNPKNVAV